MKSSAAQRNYLSAVEEAVCQIEQGEFITSFDRTLCKRLLREDRQRRRAEKTILKAKELLERGRAGAALDLLSKRKGDKHG